MNLERAMSLFLGNLNQPVISCYDICLGILEIASSKKIFEEKVNVRLEGIPDHGYIKDKVETLTRNGLIHVDKDFPGGKVFSITGKKYHHPGEVVCSVDPFTCVSHLSAMEFHGITDRLPKILYISTPSQLLWSEYAWKKMQKDLGKNYVGYMAQKLPRLKKIGIKRIGAYPIKRISTEYHGAFRNVRDSKLKVSTIGRTFLDMVREPGHCGGIRHVMDVYREYAPRYSGLIIDEVEQHGRKIEKVRAGYLLEEVCGIADERIDKWVKCVQRGGSRKLDPESEYSSSYSKKWCLSINVV